MSFGGRLLSGTEIGEGGYHGETYGAELADLAYKGLGDTVPQKAGPLAQPLVHASRCAILTGVVTTFFLSFFRLMVNNGALGEGGYCYRQITPDLLE